MRLIHRPILCNYYVTYRCNATCSFCDIWEKPSPYVTLENARENMLDLKKLGVKVIDFTGGEPLLHQKIDQLLKMAKDLGFITTLTTNGLLYPKWAEKIRGLVDMLHFSLDYANKEEHDKARGVACFDFVQESIRMAKNLGERPDILFTAFPKNINQLKRVYEEICLPNNLVLIINPSFQYNNVDADNLSKDDLVILSKWGKMKGVYLNEAFILLRTEGGNKVADSICKAASSTIVISPENKLMLPCYHLGLQQFDINANLYDLYNRKEVRDLIKLEGKMPACEGCTINCYMQPSFAVELNRFWWKALPSTIKYNRMKGTWKAWLFNN